MAHTWIWKLIGSSIGDGTVSGGFFDSSGTVSPQDTWKNLNYITQTMRSFKTNTNTVAVHVSVPSEQAR
jgi:hypothetical protein